MDRPEYYVCDNCYNSTLDRDHVHITNRMRFNSSFGNFTPEPYQFCCECYRAVQGDCDVTDKWSVAL
jgi:hypothetical protein